MLPAGRDHGMGGYNSLLFEWLRSLRFRPEVARGYTTALVGLGFDDLQSLREDATQDDLHRAGMKPGHVKRALKALDVQPSQHQHHPHYRQQSCGTSSSGHACAQQQQAIQLATETSNFRIAAGHNGEANGNDSSDSGASSSSRSSNNITSKYGHPGSTTSTTTATTTDTTTSDTNTTNNSNNNAAAAAAASGGWVVRNADGSIRLPPGVHSFVCEDGKGQRLRFAVAPPSLTRCQEAETLAATSVRAAAGRRGGAIRRETSRGGGGVVEGKTKSLTPPTSADGASVPSQATFHSDQERANAMEEREEHPKTTRGPQHAAVADLPSYRLRAVATRLDGASHSDGDESELPLNNLYDYGRSSGGSAGGGGRVADLLSTEPEHQSMPIVLTRQDKSSARSRLPGHGMGEERGGNGNSDGGRRGEIEAASTGNSPRTDSGLFHGDFTPSGRSIKSLGDVSPLLGVWGSNSAAAGTVVVDGDAYLAAYDYPLGYQDRDLRHQHQQFGTIHAMRRRSLCPDAREGAGGACRPSGYKHRRAHQPLQHPQQQQQEQQAPQYMTVLTSPPQKLSVTADRSNTPKSFRRAFCGEIDPASSSRTPYDHDTRSSVPPCRRSRFYAAEGNALSMSSISSAGASTAGFSSGGFVRTRHARSVPPGRMEMVPTVGGDDIGNTGLGPAADVLGPGGHVKTIRRIRSNGRIMNNSNGVKSVGSPRLTRIPGGGNGSEESGENGQRCAVTSALLALPVKATTVAGEAGAGGTGGGTVVEEVGGVADVPEDIVGAICKPCSRGGGGSRALVTLDEDSVTASAEQRAERGLGCLDTEHGGHREGCGVSRAITQERPKGDGGGGGGADDDDFSCGVLSGLSLDLGNLQEQGFGVAPSYDLSEDGGTLTMHGFVLKTDGIKSTPTPNYAGFETSGRNSTSSGLYDERMRRFRPTSIQTALRSNARSPRSRDSSFEAGISGGSTARSGEGPGGSGGGALAPLPPPPPLTGTPRRTREKIILLDEIGRGAGGTVHKAIHVPSMRLVAVKVVEVHDDEKRHQILRELKTLLSMKPVPLPSPSVAAGDSISAGASGHGHFGWGEWCSGGADSGTGSSCGSLQDVDSPKCWSDLGADDGGVNSKVLVEGYQSSGSEGRDRTRTTAPLSSREGTLSSRDGTPSFPSQQQQQPQPRQQHQPQSQQRQRRLRRRQDGGGSSGASNHSRIKDHSLPVVTFHDAYMDRERGRVCMVMEYMNGGTLQQFVSGGQALSEPALAGVARSVLRGLAEMHAQRKIHRDIKPSNILLDSQGRVKISDFGVVRELNQTGSFAQTFTGTATYMSPERIKEGGHGCPSDIWSIGMVIAALALGHFPLSISSTSTDHLFHLIQAITEDPIPALSLEDFSPELCGFVDLMLRRDPAERPTAAELLEHPFLRKHNDQGGHVQGLVDLVQVAPATLPEIQSLLKKVVDYHLSAAAEEKSKTYAYGYEKDASASSSFFAKDEATMSSGGWSPHRGHLPPPLRKADVEVLAGQLQVTRTELVREYEKIRAQAECELWGDNHPPSLRRRSSGSGGGAIAPATPGFNTHGRGSGGLGEHGRRSSYFMSSPQCLDISRCPTRRPGSSSEAGNYDTPHTGGSAFSATAAPRQRRQGGGTPAGRSAAQRRSSPSRQGQGHGHGYGPYQGSRTSAAIRRPAT